MLVFQPHYVIRIFVKRKTNNIISTDCDDYDSVSFNLLLKIFLA